MTQMWVIIQILFQGNYTYLITKLYCSMKKYAVIGKPVAHSLSPVIHQQFASQFDINLEYTKIHAEPAEFDQSIREFRENGGCGLNVTLPYKKNAFDLSEQLSKTALMAKSVNTLSFRGDRIAGDNTDGTGLVNDIQVNNNINLKAKRILVLGAGGAVCGVIGPLLAQQPDVVVIANRTARKARDLEQQFCKFGPVKGCGINEIEQTKFDLVINGTAASLGGQVPAITSKVLQGVEFAYDMMYSDRPTIFIDWARQNGVANSSDGLGMLVEQAAASFYIWHERQPETRSVLEYLRNSFS